MSASTCGATAACSCLCSERRDADSVKKRLLLPRCRAGPACGNCASPQPSRARQARNAAVALFYGYVPAHVRVHNRQTPLKQYLGDMMLLLRLVLSLRRVGTSLPVHLYLSGDRHAKYERLFEEQGVQLSDAPYVNPAHWANPWHAGTFAKLHALSLAAFDKVLVLDLDCVVLRNIDHVVAWPTPSFRYQVARGGAGCDWELQSGVMLLRPNAHAHGRALRMIARTSDKLPGDRGDQSVWRALYTNTTLHELPAAFNAFKYELNDADEWASVSVLHDGWMQRWEQGHWPVAYPDVGNVLYALTTNASRLMIRAANLSSDVPRSAHTCYYQRRGATRSGILYICDHVNLSATTKLHGQ